MKKNRAKYDEFFLDLIRRGFLKVIPETGEVWRIKAGGPSRWSSKIPYRADRLDCNGYRSVTAGKGFGKSGSRGRTAFAHRLVWLWVHGSIDSNKEVNHKNLIRSDNRYDNLELITAGENQKHAYKMNARTIRVGTENPVSKLSESDVREIRLARKNKVRIKDLASRFNVEILTISRAARKVTYQNVTDEASTVIEGQPQQLQQSV